MQIFPNLGTLQLIINQEKQQWMTKILVSFWSQNLRKKWTEVIPDWAFTGIQWNSISHVHVVCHISMLFEKHFLISQSRMMWILKTKLSISVSLGKRQIFDEILVISQFGWSRFTSSVDGKSNWQHYSTLGRGNLWPLLVEYIPVIPSYITHSPGCDQGYLMW